MKTRKTTLLLCLYLLVTIRCFAQTGGILNPPVYPTLTYIKDNTPNRKPVSYTNLREADVMWSKRIWRVIDLRQKINHPLYYPTEATFERKSVFDVIKDAATKGNVEIICFDNPATDDEFRYPLTPTEVLKKLTIMTTQMVENINTGELEPIEIPDDVEAEDIWKYWVKEDWFFDKERSVLDVRIMGLCPLVEKITQDGTHTGADKPLFWIYFPEARPVFARQEVYMRHNDAQRRTIDDIFWKRMFDSYIRKESNVYDRGIYDYKTGLDQLLESERVKNDIFTFEHDLWHF